MICSVCPSPMFLFLDGKPYCQADWLMRLPKIRKRVKVKQPRVRRPRPSKATGCNPHRHGREPNPVDVEALRRDFAAMKVRDVAVKHHINMRRVYQLGIQPRPVGVRLGLERDEQAILERVQGGATFEAIKKEFKIGSKRLHQIAGKESRGCRYCTRRFPVKRANQQYCKPECRKRAELIADAIYEKRRVRA